jgi:hypothetical protein
MAKTKSLERRVEKLTAALEAILKRGLIGSDVNIADEGNRTVIAAAYLQRSPGTLATWRATTPTPGPAFSYEGSTPVYSKADLDAWLEARRASGRKRTVAANVGRPPGSRNRRRGVRR